MEKRLWLCLSNYGSIFHLTALCRYSSWQIGDLPWRLGNNHLSALIGTFHILCKHLQNHFKNFALNLCVLSSFFFSCETSEALESFITDQVIFVQQCSRMNLDLWFRLRFLLLCLSLNTLLLSLCDHISLTGYSSEHGFFLTLVGWGQRTARMASSNTVFRPRWVKAEHSKYFTASIHTWRRHRKHVNTTTCIDIKTEGSRAKWVCALMLCIYSV